MPVCLKDNNGMKGEENRAGLHGDIPVAPERADSAPAERLDQWGAVFIGRLNMTELAYTALGLGSDKNPGEPGRTGAGTRRFLLRLSSRGGSGRSARGNRQ